jgi:hypothetical protein
MKAVTPSTWSWNVVFEQELARNTTVELAYVGTKGVDQLKFYDANQVGAGDLNKNGVSDRLEFARTQGGGDTSSVRPFGSAFGNQRIVIWGHDGESLYHSLQAQFLTRFGGGSQFQGSYTWSRTIGDIPLDDSGGMGADNSITDLSNPGLDRGLAKTHRTHIFNASLILLLPSLENKTGFVKQVFGGWELASIVAAASGQAVSVYTGSIPGLNGGPSGTGFNDNQRPNRVPGVSCKPSGGPKEQILNRDAFTLAGFQLGTIGDSGRGVCEGPNLFTVDLSLYKNIKLSDRVKVQLRFEVFNVFNRANFLQNNLVQTMNVSSPTFDTGDPGTATRITGATLPLSFGQSTGTRDPRQAQFGLKLIF